MGMRHQLNYGRGEHFINVDGDIFVKPQELNERLLAVFRAPDYRPPTLPRIELDDDRVMKVIATEAAEVVSHIH